MDQDQPVIVIKRKSNKHAHHGGAWKVAYADFVTAMMAFFLVMWILGLNQESRKSIASYFNDPTGMMRSSKGGHSVIAISNETARNKKPTVMPSKRGLLRYEKNHQALEQAKQQIEKMIKESPKFGKYQKNVEITLSREGLRIELLEDKEPLFFETGSATLRRSTVELLQAIGPVLSKLENDIIIEGHTDKRPYSGGMTSYNNMDLSSDRANAASKALEPKLAPDQLREVRGLAAHRLRRPDDPYHYSNRRVSVLVAALGYIEGVPTKNADENGLLGLKPGAPDLQGEFLSAAQEAVKGDTEEHH